MILDKQNIFSEDQAVTASAISTNVIDLGTLNSKNQLPGERGRMRVFIEVTTAFATLTSLTFTLYSDNDVAFGSPTTLAASAAIAAASLVAGYRIYFDLPPISERYLAMYYTVGGSSATAGKVFAALVFDEQTNGIQ